MVPNEEVIHPQVVKKFASLYGTQSFTNSLESDQS
jgi:hypothetical protein